MRKLAVLLLISLLIVGFSSCKKNDIVENNNIKKLTSGKVGLTPIGTLDITKLDETDPHMNSRQQDMRMLYCEWGWVWDEDEGYHWGIVWCRCFCITHNCLPDVVITPATNMQSYTNFKSHFDNGTLPDYFGTNDYQSIFPGLDDLGVVDELHNGEITLYLRHDTLIGKDLYIGLPQGTVYSNTDTSWMSETKCVLVIDDEN